MSSNLSPARDSAEERVRAAFAELAGHAEPPCRRPAVPGGNDPDVDQRGGGSSGEDADGDRASLANAASGCGSSAISPPRAEHRRSTTRLMVDRRAHSVPGSSDRQEHRRRALASAAAFVLLVGGVIGIAWRQRNQSAARIATVPGAPPTVVPQTNEPSVPSDAGTGSSSIVGGTLADGAAPNSSPSSAVTNAGSLTPSSSSSSASVPGPNGGASADPDAAPSRTITAGAMGADVLALQNRLSELGFVVGSPDGVYSAQTIHAVWAFQTLVLGTSLDAATDEVTPELWSAIQAPVTIAPRRPAAASARHIEIYLPEQVLVIFDGPTPLLIAHVSTGAVDDAGNPQPYCEHIDRTVDRNGAPLDQPIPGEACGEARTPGGIFTIHRMAEGYHEGLLGGMRDPVYFNYEIAIHGAQEVPLRPSSHGSVLVGQAVMSSIQDLVAVGDEVAVWNGEQAPDQVSVADALPTFDRFTRDDPNDLEGPPPGGVG